MKSSEQLANFGAAFAKAQATIEGAVKGKVNPHLKNKYADLSSCWDACRESFTSNGISVIQGNTPSPGGVLVVTRLLHASGEWIEDDGLFVPATKNDAQGFGSALTYARRYGLCAMAGISPEDDDGAAAGGKKEGGAKDFNAAVAAGIEKITAQQLNELTDLILHATLSDNTKAPAYREAVAVTVKHLGIATLADMPAARFNGVVASMKKKIAAQGEPA